MAVATGCRAARAARTRGSTNVSARRATTEAVCSENAPVRIVNTLQDTRAHDAMSATRRVDEIGAQTDFVVL